MAGVQLDAGSAAAMPLILQLARAGHRGSIDFVREFPVSEARWAAGEQDGRPTSVEEYIQSRQVAEHHLLADFLSGFDLGGLDVRMAALPGREGLDVVAYPPAAGRPHRSSRAATRLTFWDRFFRHPLENVLRDLPCALLLHRPGGRE